MTAITTRQARLDPIEGVEARRWRAVRLARLLTAGASALGGFASATAAVAADDGRVLVPSVLVALGDPPRDGVLRRAPVLVVELDEDADPQAWRVHGAEAVWVAAPGRVRCWSRSDGAAVVGVTGILDVPGRPELRVAAEEVASPEAQPRAGGARLREAVPSTAALWPSPLVR